MFFGVCPKCGSVNNLKLTSINSSTCKCIRCKYTDFFRVFNKIKIGDILEIDNIKYLVRKDGLYKLVRENIDIKFSSFKKIGFVSSSEELFCK